MRSKPRPTHLLLCLLLTTPLYLVASTAADVTPCYIDGHELRIPGDVNGDCRRNLVDVTLMIRHIFIPPQEILEACGDVDCNGRIDATDLTHLVRFCFLGGPELMKCP